MSSSIVSSVTSRTVRAFPVLHALLNELRTEWTYLRRGDNAGVKADHVSEGVAGTDPADIVLRADNILYASGYTQAKVACSADDVVLHAASGIVLGSNGDQGCKLTLDASAGRPVFALGNQFTTPSGTDSEKITALIAILNTLGLFTAP